MEGNIDEKNQLNEVAPPTPIGNTNELDVMNYFCTECSSLIEILLINDENYDIKFRCINNHNKEILIKEYLKHLEKNKDIIINEKCDLHNEEYSFYCFDCQRHICNKCIKLNKEHKNHKKEYILEVQPEEEYLEKKRNKIEE